MTVLADQRRDLAGLWRYWAVRSAGNASPLYAEICRGVAEDDDLLDLVLRTPPDAHQPTVLLGAVHYLLLGGDPHPLGARYEGGTTDDAFALFRDFCLNHVDELLAVCETRRTQTNEVGRVAVIAPALTWVAQRLGRPLHLVDVGTSAGLNLRCDRYHIDYGEHGTTGPADAAVRVRCEVRGNPPIAATLPAIATRIGIDRSPIDVRDPDTARWLLACMVPGEGRLERVRVAIAEAQADPPVIMAGDALTVLPAVLGELPPGGTACVMTTWMYAYLHPEPRLEFDALLAEAAATTGRPVAWIVADTPGIVQGLEPGDGEGNDPDASALGVVVFAEGKREAVHLADVGTHGQWLHWRAQN
ncbi:MAG: DUF2332 domain-containing protein [Acidimicrobiales bacterium]